VLFSWAFSFWFLSFVLFDFFEEELQELKDDNDTFVEDVIQAVLSGLCHLCQSTEKMNKIKGFVLIGTMQDH
jgi:hypothetical protein